MTGMPLASAPLFAGVELGGTKCVCLIGTGPDDVRRQEFIPTGADPQITLDRIEQALRRGLSDHGPVQALGIASFGPLDLARDSPHYGSITSTTKPGWRNTPLLARMTKAFSVPIHIDTDVNGAALAEGRWGAARGLNNFAYVTVGTGVGVGLVVGDRPLCGFSHPELGHIRVVRKAGDLWKGACVFHGDCVEGLASGTAIRERTGKLAQQLAADHPVWELAAHALAQLLHALVLSTAPSRIVLGGGVLEGRPELLPMVRTLLLESLNGYLDLESLVGAIEDYVTVPGLAALAGPLGALALAADAGRTRV